MKHPALIDPPATRMSPIPAGLWFFGETHDPAALEAWWHVMTATGTKEEIGRRAEWMAERILEDPQQALDEMRSFLPEADAPIPDKLLPLHEITKALRTIAHEHPSRIEGMAIDCLAGEVERHANAQVEDETALLNSLAQAVQAGIEARCRRCIQ